MKLRILLIGSFGAGNIGDELILSQTLSDYPDTLVMTADKKASEVFLEKSLNTVSPFPTGVRSFIVSFFSIKKLFKSKNIDQIVFPGGGLFKANWKAIWIWYLHVWWCQKILPNTPIYFESQGVDLPKNWILRKMVQWAFRKAEKITVRDQVSANNLALLGFQNVSVVPDRGEQLVQSTDLITLPKKKQILLNAAESFDFEILNKKIVQKWNDHELIFVVFDEQDIDAIPQEFSGIIAVPQTKTDLFDLLSVAEVCIGQRFHFLVCGNHFCPGKTWLLGKPYAPKTATYAHEKDLNSI